MGFTQMRLADRGRTVKPRVYWGSSEHQQYTHGSRDRRKCKRWCRSWGVWNGGEV